MAAAYLQTQSTQFPDIAEHLQKCIGYVDKKLYHQVTDLVEELLKLRPNGFDFVEFEKQVLKQIRNKMNLLRYAQIVVKISLINLDGSPKEGVAFMDQAIAAVDDKNAQLLLRSQIAYFELKQDWKQCKESLETIEAEIQSNVKARPPSVFAHFYFVEALLWKSQNNSEKFYRSGMSYLGYSNVESVDNTPQWAEDLAMAALVAPKFYDFGELSLHPIIRALQGTEREWVLDVLNSFIDANLKAFETTMAKYQKRIGSEPMLQNKESVLNEKIRLLALVRLAFDKPSFERIIKFDEISQITSCKSEEVETLVMRAMSRGLIQGIMDEIDTEVNITYVKPRILDMQAIGNLETKTGNWVRRIEDTQNELEPLITDLFK